MDKVYFRKFFLTLLALFAAAPLFAQTITIRNFDTGPYGPGSSISVPFTLGDDVVFNANYRYQLFLSNSSGVFPATPLVTVNDFYATYINAVIPASTPAGSGYRLRVVIPNPANPGGPPIATAETSPFTISGSTGVTAGMTAPEVVRAPDMLGLCSAKKTGDYTFTNSSSGGSTASILIYNELSHSVVTTPDTQLDPTVTFNAGEANYTITVRAANNGIIGTYSYTLFNRPYYKSFGSAGTSTVCLSNGGDLTYNVDIGSPTGLQNNYPGLLYRINWGDGSSSTLTIAQIKAESGRITHTYVNSSCGRIVNNQRNVFRVDLTIQGLICDPRLTPTTEYAKVLQAPVNKIEETSPKTGCVGEEVTIINDSFTGQDPDSQVASCENTNATYTWLIDGVPTYTGYLKSRPFVHTFTTPGEHIVTLRIENSDPNFCTSDDVDWPICIKARPVASFTVNSTACTGTAVMPNSSASVVDNSTPCTEPVNYVFNWTVTPATGRTITGANTPNPTINFSQPGVYTVNMSITGNCTVDAPPQTIRVEAPPTATLSPDVTLCGIDIPRNFNETSGPTQTVITGTPENESPNYRWQITGGDYDFVAPSTANSRYPTIIFHDEAVYTVSIIHQNSCDPDNTPDDVQIITIRSAPVPLASTYPPACPNTPIQLNAQVSTNTGVTGIEWTGAGTFLPDRNVANPTYLPTAAERDAGLAELSFTVHTNIEGCQDIPSSPIEIVIRPLNRVTSDDTVRICSGTRVNYRPAAAPGSTFRWSVLNPPSNAVISPGPTSGTQITDLITNNDPLGREVAVDYEIIPITSDGCEGAPFTFTVIVSPGSITADFTASATEACGPTTITFTPVSQASTGFEWSINGVPTSTDRIFEHTFNPVEDGSGTERQYTVTLTITNTCVPTTPVSMPILISPATAVAIAEATPSGSCGPVDITVENLSPGNNKSYRFRLLYEDGSEAQPPSPVFTIKESYTFTEVQPPATGTRNVFVRLEVVDKCDNLSTDDSQLIPLTSAILVSGMAIDKTDVCLGDQVNFINNSTGLTFTYNIYREGETTPVSIPVDNTNNFPYEFAAPGNYEVSITPGTICGIGAESSRVPVVVHDRPTAAFTENVFNCNNLTYQFTVTGTLNPDFRYTWDFGDGSSITNPTPPPHKYETSGTYTVTLTITNVQPNLPGCESVITKQITVNPPLVADFDVLPSDTIQIPNNHFSFRDRSTGGPVAWEWDFNSFTIQPSTQQNPEVTYSTLDTGYHHITLTVRDANGCDTSITKRIKITGTFGQLYVPNAFIPTSNNNAVNTFMAKGRGIASWTMEIYNKWGQLMWKTDKLTSDGEPMEGWDGNYQGSPAPQGAYVWQITAKFKNGTDWKGMSYDRSPPKRMGVINLIR